MTHSYSNQDFVCVYACTSPVDAHVILGLLEDAEIEAYLNNESSVGIIPGATYALGGVRVMVRASDEARALELINAPFSEDAEL